MRRESTLDHAPGLKAEIRHSSIRRNDTLRSLPTFVLALGCALARLSLVAASDPAANGPFPATRQTLSIPGTQGAMLTTDVYYPSTNGIVNPGASRCPVIVSPGHRGE